MHRTNRAPQAAFWGLLLGLGLGGLCGSSARAQAPLPPPQPGPGGPGAVAPGGPPGAPAAMPSPGSPVPTVVVPINGTQKLQMGGKQRIATVLNQKDTVARVSPVIGDPTSVIVTGLEPGITRVVFTDANGRQETVDVVVQIDVEYLRVLLRRAVPTAFVEPIPAANNTIVLTGTVAHAEDVDTIMRTAQSVVLGPDRVINALRVGGVQQVQLCVVVARVARSKLRQYGFAFFEAGQHHKFASTLGGSFADAAAGTVFPAEASSLTSQGANVVFGFLNNEQEFFGFLQALKTEGLAKVLAEPRLVALSGRSASFLDGGEQAVPIPAGLGQIGVQFEEFGTRLNFIPVVLGNGKIHLEVEPEVSQLDPASGVNIQGTTVPGRVTQRVHTSVEMEDGQTLLIGGLIQHTVSAQDVKVPVVGDIPFIGAAFSSKNYNEEEHELVILVTPHLVDAMSCDQLPKYLPGQETRSPDDFELFLEGILEAPHGSRDVCPDGRYTPAYKNGPTAGQFPCGGGHCGGDGAFCGSSCGGSCGGSCGSSCGGSCAGGSCGLGGGLTEGHDGAPATGTASAQPLSATKATARTGGAGDDDASPRPSKLPAATAEADRLK